MEVWGIGGWSVEGCRCGGGSVEGCRWWDVGMKAVLQHGFMCTVETMKERVLLPDVEEHVGVDIPSILVRNRGREKRREKGRMEGGGRKGGRSGQVTVKEKGRGMRKGE